MHTKQEEFRLAESKLMQEIREIEMQAHHKRAALYKLRSEYSESLCPLKIGDVVKHTGFSHTGKKARVTGYVPAYGYYDTKIGRHTNWTATGTVLKKDGSDSSFTVEIHGYTDPQN